MEIPYIAFYYAGIILGGISGIVINQDLVKSQLMNRVSRYLGRLIGSVIVWGAAFGLHFIFPVISAHYLTGMAITFVAWLIMEVFLTELETLMTKLGW
jgi:hypothetical protein